MHQIERVVSDKGSKYAVTGGLANDNKGVKSFINKLCQKKKYAKATHNTWAVIFDDGRQLKSDDGESGAGAIILRMLERKDLVNHVVVVTRWYGGVHLGADRFKHVKTCVQTYFDFLDKK